MNNANIKTDFNLKYDPTTFWLEMGGKRYRDLFVYDWVYQMQETMLMDYLKPLKFKSVLEIGCGFGRITKLLLENFDIEDYVAVDMSPDQLGEAIAYTADIEVPEGHRLHFATSDIQSYMPEHQYNLVISCEVLMHILPRDIKRVIRKTMSLSNRHVINVDWYEEPSELVGKEIAPINFVHDYRKLYHGCDRIPIRNQERDTKQSIFHKKVRPQE